jgi:hypothetical protein
MHVKQFIRLRQNILQKSQGPARLYTRLGFWRLAQDGWCEDFIAVTRRRSRQPADENRL